jgi:hypothetical protein
LRRHNGRSHEHTNQIEASTFYDFHIHMATERYQELGMREDAYAEATDRFGDMTARSAACWTMAGPPPADRPHCRGFKAPPSCHCAAQLWQFVKMPVPRDESQIVFYRHCGDPQIVIRNRRTGAFELHE